MPVNCSEVQDTLILVNQIIDEIGCTRADLIPILQKISNECGYISNSAVNEIARRTNIQPSQIFAVATFYRMLMTKPHGRHVVQFCESAPCHVAGGREVFQALKDILQIEPGQTSPDNRWTFLTTSCLGVCGIGPVVLIDTDTYGNVTSDHLSSILEHYE
ncbi:MAG TPA: NADH-quinone oxidoreductase subunit NuoE [Anaerolineaceae bacterium]|nr:NADH-quinone oxidoreductase subunit NuoE [Anaerolineaceae bacterium]